MSEPAVGLFEQFARFVVGCLLKNFVPLADRKGWFRHFAVDDDTWACALLPPRGLVRCCSPAALVRSRKQRL